MRIRKPNLSYGTVNYKNALAREIEKRACRCHNKYMFFEMCGLKKDRFLFLRRDLLAAGVFGDSFGSFGNSMLSQFSG